MSVNKDPVEIMSNQFIYVLNGVIKTEIDPEIWVSVIRTIYTIKYTSTRNLRHVCHFHMRNISENIYETFLFRAQFYNERKCNSQKRMYNDGRTSRIWYNYNYNTNNDKTIYVFLKLIIAFIKSSVLLKLIQFFI